VLFSSHPFLDIGLVDCNLWASIGGLQQVRGKPANPRSDIFSFGSVLYEMLSGERAFRGDSAAETMAAIAQKDPPELRETAIDDSNALSSRVLSSFPLEATFEEFS
jgi:serine/threonine protein kinase